MKHGVRHSAGVILLAAAALLALVGEARAKPPLKAETLLNSAENCQKSLFASKERQKYRHNWILCIERYQSFAHRFPQHEHAARALFIAANMYSKLHALSGKEQDLDEAIRLYKHVSERYPESNLADDAQFRIGEIYYEAKNDLTQAYVEFLKVDIRFPSGDMRPRARTMLDKLSGVLAKRDAQRTEKRESVEPQGMTEVQGIRHWSTPNYTRVVIDISRPVKYESHIIKEDPSIKKPRRLYVDLKDALVKSDINTSIPIDDGLLKGARAGQYAKETVRVVLDIDSIGGYKIFPLHDPFRIVIDVQGKEEKAKPAREEVQKKDQEAAAEPSKPGAKIDRKRVRRGIRKEKSADQSVTLARQLGLGVRKIVIDPGHGGKDPGCFVDGIEEKTIVLELAKLMAEKIRERLQCETVLTRDRDLFVPLERRTAFANMHKADLFISLHINAHKQDEVHGLETYFLNMATDERAVMVAARENATSEKNISDLQKILNDLMLNTKISESSKLAHEVQKGILVDVKKRFDKVKDLGVKQAPFYVLIGAEMPAVLVEVGFITNEMEKKRLLSKPYIETVANGLVAGIGRYVKGIEMVNRGR
ncbi:MAG: N-acetylmuramoyl-L-alanine amidase [Desulfobacteraceae bacterium]|nr:MAG: N-acetylmuramoyl-L-alanine amidase [Desulfobacteraceae bacterium]